MGKSKLWLIFILGTVILAGCSSNQGSAVSVPTPPQASPAPRFTSLTPQPAATPAALRGYGPGEMAPDFRYSSGGSQMVSLSDLRGKPVMINFWASWCPPCRAEMPWLEQVYKDRSWQERGLQLLTVTIDEDPAKAKEFMAGNGYTFPVLLDIKQIVAGAYHVYAYPTTFFINRNGIIETRRDGAFPDKATIEKELNKITAK